VKKSTAIATITKTEAFSGWTLAFGADGEPMVHDLEIGERLGFERPRKVRDLIKALVRDGFLSDSDICPVVERAPEFGRRPAREFYLTELGAILVAMRSETPTAQAMARSIGQLFVAWRRGQLEAVPRPLQLDAAVASSARVGDDPIACDRYRLSRRRAANATGYSSQRLDGYVRRTQRVSSWKALSMHLLDHVVGSLEIVERREVQLLRRAEQRLLEAARKSGQLELFEAKLRQEGMH